MAQDKLCESCGNKFRVVRETGVSRCPECGSLRVTDNAVERTHSPHLDEKRLYKCPSCLHEFEWDESKGQASCPACGEVEVIKPPPVARIVGKEDPPVFTKAQLKRIRFIRAAWRNYVGFRNACNGLMNAAALAGVSEESRLKLRADLDAMLADLEAQHERRLDEYEKIGAST